MEIEFGYDFSSRWTCLASTQLESGVKGASGRLLWRPMLLDAVLAAAMSISSAWAGLVLLAQSVAGTLGALPVYAFTRDLAGVSAARWAAAFLLFDSTLVAYAHLLWPETLFTLLVSLAFFGVARVEPGRRARAASLGVLVGVAMSLKPVFGLFGLVLVVSWLVRHGGRGLPLALAFGLAAALVVAPWAVRNQLRYGPTILLENQGPYNLWVGNDPRGPLVVNEEWMRLGDAVTRSRVGLERGSAAIAADFGGFLRKAARRLVRLLVVDPQEKAFFRRKIGDPDESPVREEGGRVLRAEILLRQIPISVALEAPIQARLQAQRKAAEEGRRTESVGVQYGGQTVDPFAQRPPVGNHPVSRGQLAREERGDRGEGEAGVRVGAFEADGLRCQLVEDRRVRGLVSVGAQPVASQGVHRDQHEVPDGPLRATHCDAQRCEKDGQNGASGQSAALHLEFAPLLRGAGA